MCPGSCAVFLCADCRKAAQDDKRAAFDAEARVATLTADVEAHRLRCEQLEKQLETWKRAGLESDRLAREASQFMIDEMLVTLLDGLWWVTRLDEVWKKSFAARDEAITFARNYKPAATVTT